MSDTPKNTFSSYLGEDFQQKLIWQLLVEGEFAEKAIPQLAIEYFDDPYIKRLFVIIMEFYNEFNRPPNLQNKSIHQAINRYKTPNNQIEEESLFAVIKKVIIWNEMVINKQMMYDGDIIQKATTGFVKQQEYRKLAEYILNETKSGGIKNKYFIGEVEERVLKIAHIGDEEDYGTEITEDIENVLRKEFRQTIPTGIDVIDSLTGGGLGKTEIGIILAPSGIGKSTILTKIANTAYELEFNVLQIIFEDTEEQIKRKHFAIWTKIPLNEMDDRNEEVKTIVYDRIKNKKNRGRLIIKRFSQEDTTMKDIRNWMDRFQKKWGVMFDLLVLDYLDSVDSHKRTTDRNEAELVVVKSFEALAADYRIPAWTAIQANRTGFRSEFVEADQSGGNIKRVQKSHFFMSIAKSADQKETNEANIRIIKARFAQDGQTFEDCTFNNNTMEISIDDDRYNDTSKHKNRRKYAEDKVESLDENSQNKENSTIENQKTTVSNEKEIADINPDDAEKKLIDIENLNKMKNVYIKNR